MMKCLTNPTEMANLKVVIHLRITVLSQKIMKKNRQAMILYQLMILEKIMINHPIIMMPMKKMKMGKKMKRWKDGRKS